MTSSCPRHATAAIAIILTACAYYWLAWWDVQTFVLSIDHCDILFCDFARHYYRMGEVLYITKLPIAGYYYSPFFAFLLSLISPFPDQVALWIWGALQAGSIGLLVILSGLDVFRTGRRFQLWHLAAVLFSYPVLSNFKWGQVSVAVVACVMATLLLYRRGNWLPAAILLALAASINFYPAMYVLYFLLLRDWRFVGVFLAAAFFFLVCMPAAALGPANAWGFYTSLRDSLAGLQADVMHRDPNSQYIVGVIERISNADPASAFLITVRWMGYAIFAGNLMWVGWSARKWKNREPLAVVLIFLSTPFIIGTSWPHYFSYLPLCQVTLLQDQSTANVRVGRICALLIWVSIGVSSIVAFNIVGDWKSYNGWGALFFANAICLMAAYLRLASPHRPLL